MHLDLHQVFCLQCERLRCFFLFSVSPLFLCAAFLRVPLSFFFSSTVRSLAELQRERVHQGKREEKEREATAGSGQESGEGGVTISITVPFGNRDTSISNKTAKPRQIALTWGFYMRILQHHPETSYKVEKQRASASALYFFLPSFLLVNYLSPASFLSLSLAGEVADICRVHLKRKKCVRGV